MKSFIILLVLVCIIAFAEFSKGQNENVSLSDEYTKNIIDCQKTTDVSDDYAANYDFTIAKSRNDECFLACIEKKYKIMGDNNYINIENLTNVFSNYALNENPELIDNIIEVYKLCNDDGTIDDSDECEAAKNLYSCIIPKKIEVLDKLNMSITEFRATFIVPVN